VPAWLNISYLPFCRHSQYIFFGLSPLTLQAMTIGITYPCHTLNPDLQDVEIFCRRNKQSQTERFVLKS
jgi:hypothetical protein